MLVGDSPFEGDDEEELFEQILKKVLRYPSKLSSDSTSLLDGFLEREPRKRLGCSRTGRQDIQNHPFFAPLDWAKLERREVHPLPVICLAITVRCRSSLPTCQSPKTLALLPTSIPSLQKRRPICRHPTHMPSTTLTRMCSTTFLTSIATFTTKKRQTVRKRPRGDLLSSIMDGTAPTFLARMPHVRCGASLLEPSSFASHPVSLGKDLCPCAFSFC